MKPLDVHRACVVAVLALIGISALCEASRAADLPWELRPVRCDRASKAMTPNENLICSDPDIHTLDEALSAAYREKAQQLDAGQLDALRIDHNLWAMRTCVGDRSGAHPLSRDSAQTCLLQDILKRRDFVRELPVDRPEVPYRLSRFERTLLENYAKIDVGIVNGMENHPQDAVRRALRRIFAAILPATLSLPDAHGSPADQFIQTMLLDSAVKQRAAGYFVDQGAKPHDGLLGGMFAVDMETGDVALAMIDSSDHVIQIWEKACLSASFRDGSQTLFLQVAEEIADRSASNPNAKVPVRVNGTVTSCREAAPTSAGGVTAVADEKIVDRVTKAIESELHRLSPSGKIMSCDRIVRSDENAGRDLIYGASCLVSTGDPKPIRLLMCGSMMVRKFTVTDQYFWGVPPLGVIGLFVRNNCAPGG